MKPERVLIIAALAFGLYLLSLPLTGLLHDKGVAINA